MNDTTRRQCEVARLYSFLNPDTHIQFKHHCADSAHGRDLANTHSLMSTPRPHRMSPYGTLGRFWNQFFCAQFPSSFSCQKRRPTELYEKTALLRCRVLMQTTEKGSQHTLGISHHNNTCTASHIGELQVYVVRSLIVKNDTIRCGMPIFVPSELKDKLSPTAHNQTNFQK